MECVLQSIRYLLLPGNPESRTSHRCRSRFLPVSRRIHRSLPTPSALLPNDRRSRIRRTQAGTMGRSHLWCRGDSYWRQTLVSLFQFGFAVCRLGIDVGMTIEYIRITIRPFSCLDRIIWYEETRMTRNARMILQMKHCSWSHCCYRRKANERSFLQY